MVTRVLIWGGVFLAAVVAMLLPTATPEQQGWTGQAPRPDPALYLARITSSAPHGLDRAPFFPGTPRFEGESIPMDQLAGTASCGLTGCHPDVTHQWEQSVHHLASFNNPLYRASVDYTRERMGDAGVRWCAGCHDPVLLLSRTIDGPVTPQTPGADAGVTCLVCHTTVGLQDLTGNGRYVLHPRDVSGLDPELPWAPLVQALLKRFPAAHRASFSSPLHLESEFCSSCHRVSLHPAQNGYRWLRGQDTFGTWLNGGASGRVARSFATPAQPRRCQDCHMPLVPSEDAGADNGTIRSHTFPGANSAMPMLAGYEAQAKRVEANLKGALVVDLFALRVGGRGSERLIAPLEGAALPPGQSVAVDVVVRNKAVGHAFPEGVLDNKEAWVELEVLDQGGRRLALHGGLDAQGDLPADAHRYGAVLLDSAAQRLDKRNIGDFRVPLYRRVIGPGQSDVARFVLTVPEGVAGLTFRARLLYRKADREYTRWAFSGARHPGDPMPAVGTFADTGRYLFDPERTVPELPVIEIGAATVTLPVGPLPAPGAAAAGDTWERWYNYGVGMLVQGDLGRAARVFEEMSARHPAQAQAWVGRARVALADGDPDAALRWLEEATAHIDPSADPKMELRIAALRAEAWMRAGRYEEAVGGFRQVTAALPQDRSAWLDLGYSLFQLRDFAGASDALERVLALDPDDAGAWSMLARSWAAQGESARAEQARQIFDALREDPDLQGLRQQHLAVHPERVLEAQLSHEHALELVGGP